jgi:hypothetical protein
MNKTICKLIFVTFVTISWFCKTYGQDTVSNKLGKVIFIDHYFETTSTFLIGYKLLLIEVDEPDSTFAKYIVVRYYSEDVVKLNSYYSIRMAKIINKNPSLENGIFSNPRRDVYQSLILNEPSHYFFEAISLRLL